MEKSDHEAPRISIGPYRIQRKLGEGGMAEVFLATDARDGREVAVKVLPESMARNAELVRRFQREFETCARIDHPNVVKIFDTGRHEGRLWYAMAYLPFPDLQKILDGEGALPLVRVIRYMSDMAAAFACFHPLGIIHRDLKPTNLIVGKGDRLILVDFGLVKDVNVTAMTKTGSMLGTPQYMSPELVRGQGVGPLSDIFQLGVISYEMIAGQKAFDGENVFEVARMCVQDEPLPLCELRGEIPEGLAELVAACMAKDPEGRPQSGSEILSSLEALRAQLSVGRSSSSFGALPSPLAASSGDGRSTSTGVLGRAARIRARREGRPTTGVPRQSGAHAAPPGLPRQPSGALAAPSDSPRQPSGAHRPPLDGSATSPSLSQSLHRIVTEPERMLGFWALLAVVLAIVAALGAWFLGANAPYVVRDVVVEKGLHSVRIRWNSKRTYPSRLELVTEKGRTLHTGTVTSLGEHEVLVRGLAPGSMAFLILLPDESRSLEQRFKLEELELELAKASARPEGLVIEFETRPAVRLEALVARQTKEEKVHVLDGEEQVHHELLLPASPWAIRSLRLRARRGRDEQIVDLRPELRRRVEKITAQLSLDMGTFLAEVPVDVKTMDLKTTNGFDIQRADAPEEEKARRRQTIRTWLDRAVAQRGFVAAIETMRRLEPLCMRSNVLDFATRQKAFLSLQNMVALRVFHVDKGLEIPVYLKKIPTGDFGPSHRSFLPAGARTFRHDVPAKLATHRAYIRVDHGKWLSEYKSSYVANLTVQRGSDLQRAELSMDLSRMAMDASIELSLNGGVPIILHDYGQKLYQGSIFGAADPSTVKDGLNELRVRVRNVAGQFGGVKIFFRSLSLHLWP